MLGVGFRGIMTPFDKWTSPFLNQATTLLSPGIPWRIVLRKEAAADGWATSASALPYTEEIGQGVVGTLSQVASVDGLQSRIPTNLWVWLKKRLSLPPVCRGRDMGSSGGVIHHVRGPPGDLEILKSYSFLVWSE